MSIRSIACVVPVYRVSVEEIDSLVHSLADLVSTIVFVHNDDVGGVSRTLAAYAHAANIDLVACGFPVGKAEAIRCGLEFLDGRGGVEVVVQVDGHLKQNPRQIERLLSGVSGADLVIADRYGLQSLADQPHRRAVGSVFGGLVRAMTGAEIRDPFCGTRAYSWNLASKFMAGTSFGYGLELEQIIVAHSCGGSVVSVPVASNRQAHHTAVVKVEDNLDVLLHYGKTHLSKTEYMGLSHFMVLVKRRESFSMPIDWLGIDGGLTMSYVANGEDGEECYAFALSGKLLDKVATFAISQT